MKMLGAILAGGHATRFGSDKALARLRDATLLDHALNSLRPHCAVLIVVGRDDAPVQTIHDLPVPGLGPLGGIAGALAFAADHGFDAVLTTACDTPSLPDALVVALMAEHVAYAAEAPTVGRWPASLARPLLAHLLNDGPRSIRHWAATAGAMAVLPGVTLANVNTPADLADLAGA